MADSSGRTTFSDKDVEQAIQALKRGAYLLKCGKSGKPKLRPFRLSTDERSLIWYSRKKEKHVKLTDVSKVLSGHQTINFLQHSQAEKEKSFSLIFRNGYHSLDLICKDKEQAEVWCLGLAALVSASHHPQHLWKLSSREVHSFASSPVGCIAAKHKLGRLRGSAKLTKVRSLYSSPARSVVDRHFSDRMLDSSDVYYNSPRQRTFSDVRSYLDKLLPRLPHIISDSEKNVRGSNSNKDHKMVLSSKLNQPMHEAPSMHMKQGPKDVFMWGKGVLSTLGCGLNSLENELVEVDSSLPRLLEAARMLDVQNISCGEKHAALVSKHGEVFCWGEGKCGKLGHRMNMDVSYPKIVESLTAINVHTVVCGPQRTCAITDSGELYVWGDSGSGVEFSGDRSIRSQWFPHKMSGPLDGIRISKIACGDWHTAIVSCSGQLFTYGYGTFGILGHGNTQSVHEPKEVESLKGLQVKSVACGSWHTAAIVEVKSVNVQSTTPGWKLFTWGDNDKGRLGHRDKGRKLIPTCVASLMDCEFTKVSCGMTLTVALTDTGMVFTMGSSMNGQLGNPGADDATIATVEGLLKNEFVKEISAGSSHVAALTMKGRIYTWGKGENGQLGLGDKKDRNSPALVEALTDRHVESVACGSNFTLATCFHKFFSIKDQSVCNGCRMTFGFARKKHNCYNCGFTFCHSCSCRKVRNAALAPNKEKKFRVCTSCFNNLVTDTTANIELSTPRSLLLTPRELSDVKLKGEQVFQSGAKPCDYRTSASNKMKLIQRTVEFVQENKQEFEHSCRSSPSTARKWGQVSCPLQFIDHSRENSSKIVPFSGEPVSHFRQVTPKYSHLSQLESKSILLKAAYLKQDWNKMLVEEIQRLRSEVVNLVQQCQSKSHTLQHYKHKFEETWSIANDEAAKCKAAKDVIKILSNQINVLSERLSAKEISSSESSIDVYLASLENSDSYCSHQPINVKVLRDNNSTRDLNGTIMHQDNSRSSNGKTNCSPKVSKDEWVHEDEVGVYITFVILQNGKKGLKRLRFSRKHFSKKEAEIWWQNNQTRVCAKYGIERIVAPSSSPSAD